MTNEDELKKKECMVGCSCIGCCSIVRLSHHAAWSGEQPWTGVEFYQSDIRFPSLRYRLKAAWKVLRGRQDWGACLILERPQLEKMRAYLDDVFNDLKEGESK